MTRSHLLFTLALLTTGAVGAALPPAVASTGSDGRDMKCINLMSMGDTPVIDDRTILVKMKAGKVNYKRIDLAAPCADLRWGGFGYTQDSYNELCMAYALRVRAIPGEICKIADITDISDEEAKELLSHKNRK